MRFNRLRKGAIKSFLTEVAEDVAQSGEPTEHERAGARRARGCERPAKGIAPIADQGRVIGLLDVPMGTTPMLTW